MLVDSHCHLDFPEFAADREEVMERARKAGVGHFLTICTHLRKAESVLAVADAYTDASASIGTHPHHAEEELDLGKAELLRLASRPKVIAIGECGLDYHYNHSPSGDQQSVFRQHIQASLETGLPLIIHTRDAEDDTMRLLREESAGAPLKGVLHCFSSSRKLAEEALEFGLLISFSGIITFRSADDIRVTAGIVPLDRLLVETDAPFLAPIPNRGKRNEPAFVSHTAEKLAMIKEVPVRQLAERTTGNFFRLFARAVR